MDLNETSTAPWYRVPVLLDWTGSWVGWCLLQVFLGFYFARNVTALLRAIIQNEIKFLESYFFFCIRISSS